MNPKMKYANKKQKKRVAEFKPTYFFGYGSLLIPEGINGRGMYHDYRGEDLAAATLRGYERSFSGFFQGRNFYGLLENKSAMCNGVVFKIDDWFDYRALLMNEGATSKYRDHRTYWPIDVTKQIIDWPVPKGHRVITLVCREDKSNKGYASAHYISFCHKAASAWGTPFLTTFLETGGVEYNRKRKILVEIGKKEGFKLY